MGRSLKEKGILLFSHHQTALQLQFRLQTRYLVGVFDVSLEFYLFVDVGFLLFGKARLSDFPIPITVYEKDTKIIRLQTRNFQ